MKSVYIHIPFCNNICSYCDFSKLFYNKSLVETYLNALKQEILSNYKGEVLTTVYLGGGSPSCLNILELGKLKDIISLFKLDKNYEFTIELNVCDIEEEKLRWYKEIGVNRISIGIQTINEKYLKLLNRIHTKEEVINKIALVKRYFSNVNVDFMYGFDGQTMNELQNDLDFFKSLDVTHISIYSLILEQNTKLYIDSYKSIDEEIENKMYYFIIGYLEQLGFKHYEVSNFSKEGYESKHNLTYWNNKRYYGFGLGASGYIGDYRYSNTRSINNYIKGDFVLEKEYQTEELQMENEMILGLRKIKGVSKQSFFDRFGKKVEDVFDLSKLIRNNLLIDNGEYLYIPKDKLYVQNQVLVHFIGGCYDRSS